VRVGRQHGRAGSIKAEKNGVEVPVIILPVLQATLDAGPCGDLAFIVGQNGRPMRKESFGNEFRNACRKAGVPGSAHGVRKLAATRMANNGATEAQLMAVFGWNDSKMATHYTRTANRRRLAAQSIDMLNASGTSIPAPSDPVRAKGEKAK
jgi:integrase